VQIPGYLAAQDELKAAGIEEVMVFCVNDGAVMTAWQKDQGADDSLLTFYGDPSAKLTKALGLVLDHPGPMAKLGYPRSKRFAAYVVDGVVKAVEVSEKPDDPAGDDFPESSCVENMLLHVAKVSKDEL
jgi:peroxiredoxin